MKIRGLLMGALVCCLPQLAFSSGDTYFISKVKKQSVQHFLERFATETHQIVVTATSPDCFLQQVQIARLPWHTLYAVELADAVSTPRLRREVARIDKVAFVMIADRDAKADVDELQGEGYHPIAISDQAWGGTAARADSVPFASALSYAGTPEISVAFVQQKLEQIAGEKPVHVEGADKVIRERHSVEGKNLARAFLKAEFEQFGYTVSFHSYPNDKNPKGINFIAERQGTDTTKTLLLSSHLDSVTTGAADDNGSGTITLLAAASVLKDVNLRYNIRFVAFDQEEDGLVGSKAYAKMLSNAGKISELVGVINVDTAGYDSDNDGKFHVIDCDEGTSPELAKSVAGVLAGMDLPLTVVPYCTNRSDHATFWNYDIPSVTVSENYFKGDPNPCMHKSCDTTKNINFPYLTRIIQLVTATAINMAGAGG